jgi:hypothetical protein
MDTGELLTTSQAAAALRAEGLPIRSIRVAAWCRAGGLQLQVARAGGGAASKRLCGEVLAFLASGIVVNENGGETTKKLCPSPISAPARTAL